MGQQMPSKPSLLAAAANIGVPDKGHDLYLLEPHDSYQHSGRLVAPEHNTFLDFVLQFLPGHVRFRPAICRDDSFVGPCAVIDDGPNQLKVAVVAAADHAYSASRPGISKCIRRSDHTRLTRTPVRSAGRARLHRLRKNSGFVSGYAFRHTVS